MLIEVIFGSGIKRIKPFLADTGLHRCVKLKWLITKIF